MASDRDPAIAVAPGSSRTCATSMPSRLRLAAQLIGALPGPMSSRCGNRLNGCEAQSRGRG